MKEGAAIGVLAACVVLLSDAALADQYKSEARVPQAQQPAQSTQQQLQNATDPYAKAMLLRDLAAQAAAKKDYAAAAKYLDQALAQNALAGPAADQMRADLGRLRMGSGDPKSVIAGIEPQYRASQSGGANLPPEQLVALGAAYLQQKRYQDAIAPLQKGVAASRTPDLSWRRALYAAYVGAGREKEAAQVLETVVRDQPSARDDWFRLAALHLKTGDLARAQAVTEVAQRLGYLDSAEQRLQLVALTAQIGAPFQAGTLLQNWMQGGQLPANAANRRTLASLWIAARESALAIAAIEASLKDGASADLYLQLGQLRLDREEYGPAQAAFAQAIATGGKSGPALMALAVASYQQADVDGAIRAFRQAADYPAQRKLATQWVDYLNSGRAREQAVAALANRRTRDAGPTGLAAGLPGGAVALADAETAAPPTPAAAAPAAASGSGGLTPVGAEQAGNREGSIPPWTGGLTRSQWPAAYRPGGRLVDPFAADQPLFTITRANLAQYAGRLSAGHQALFAKYPDYTMPVYATRRSVAFPPAIVEATQANDGKASAPAADSIKDARLGFPFRQPKSGVEVMWNHRVRYRGDTLQAQHLQAVVTPTGQLLDFDQVLFRVLFRYSNLRDPGDTDKDNILAYGTVSAAPKGNSPDYVALFHETSNSLVKPRAIWVLIVKYGKMLRIPPVGYDQSFPGTEGIEFLDMFDMYNGLFDRYVWKLAGKRELYVPYNSFRLNDGSRKNAELLTPNHFNQAATRYELHRVWVVEATLRGGATHAFGKRVFYVDEDSWNVLLVENHDPQGALWRFQEGHLLPLYDVQAAFAAPSLTYDLKSGSYFADRLFAESPPLQTNLPMNDQQFLPAAVKNKYSR